MFPLFFDRRIEWERQGGWPNCGDRHDDVGWVQHLAIVKILDPENSEPQSEMC